MRRQFDAPTSVCKVDLPRLLGCWDPRSLWQNHRQHKAGKTRQNIMLLLEREWSRPVIRDKQIRLSQRSSVMNNDQFTGTARSIGGHIEEAAGAITNDHSLQADGIVDQVKGAAQNLYGDAKEKVRETYDRVSPVARDGVGRAVTVTRKHSLLAILAAGAAGFALAFALRNTDSSPRGSWSA
jgi:uncharacterized protein YjbJ (UPF0337 family)